MSTPFQPGPDGELPDDIAEQIAHGEKPKHRPQWRWRYRTAFLILLVMIIGVFFLFTRSGALRQWLPGEPEPLELNSVQKITTLPDCASVAAPGSMLVFDVQMFQVPGGFSGLIRTDSQGHQPCLLTHDALSASSPAISPDGRIIAYTDPPDINGQNMIYLMHSDGSGVMQLNGTSGAATAAWSPDSTKIIFSATDANRQIDIFTISSTGDHLTRLTNSAGVDFFPVPSPDGTHILFSSLQDYAAPDAPLLQTLQIYTMAADGSEIRRLTEGQAGRILPDGQIVYVSLNGGLRRIDADGQQDQALVDYPGDEIMVTPASGGVLYFTYINQHSPGGVYSWSPDTISTIYRYSVSNGQTVPVVTMTGGFIFTVSVWEPEQ